MPKPLHSTTFVRFTSAAIGALAELLYFILSILSPVNLMSQLVTFREAKAASRAVNFVRGLTVTTLFGVVCFGLMPYMILKATAMIGLVGGGFDWPWWIAAAVLLVGLVPTLWAVYSLATTGRGTPLYGACPRKLTTTGPYAYVRNPLVIGLAIIGVAAGAAWGSPWVFGWCLIGAPLWQGLLKSAEESDLEVRFRGDYRLYKQAVQCWMPRFTPYRPRA